MRFSTSLFASLAAAQAVFAAPAPAPKTPAAATVALDVVQSALSTVDTQKTDLVDFIKDDVVDLVKKSLNNVAGGVQNITIQVTPYLIDVAKPLLDGEVAVVLVLLEKTKVLVDNIKDNVTTLVLGLTDDSKKAVKTELISLLSIIDPALVPIKTLATSAIIQSTGATQKQVKAALAAVNDAGAALGPVQDAINKIV